VLAHEADLAKAQADKPKEVGENTVMLVQTKPDELVVMPDAQTGAAQQPNTSKAITPNTGEATPPTF
jgi:hypothetical protein